MRPAGPLVPVAPRDVPAVADDLDLASLRLAVDRTGPAWRRRGDAATPAAAARLLAALAGGADARAAVSHGFVVREVRDPLLMTSYYEPEITVRAAPDARFRFPVLRRPPDLVDVSPPVADPACQCTRTAGRLRNGAVEAYPSRAEIMAGALDGRGLELAWADDALAVFLLQVQGSGRLRFPDRVQPVRFAGTNGLPYRALGAVMIERGLVTREQADVPGIRRVFATLPEDQQRALLAANARYVFFKPADGGPVGSLGVPLTPGRSIAADPALLPPGSLALLVTPRVRRFVVVQDTGAAIVGPHVDLFAGAGPEAEAFAGSARDRGTLYLLTPATP